MIHDILFALWFLMPAALANSAPIFAQRLPYIRRFDAPLDRGRQFRGVDILGPHKTWRGIVSGVIVSTLVLWLQQIVVANYDWAYAFTIQEVSYASLPVLVLGPLFGLGALGGDAVKSFFKRRRGIPSGHSWLPWDQLDFILGGMLVSLPFVVLRPALYIWMLILGFGAHLLASYLGYRTGLKDTPI